MASAARRRRPRPPLAHDFTPKFRLRSRAAQPRPLNAGLGQTRRSIQAPARRADQHDAHPAAPSPTNGTTACQGAALRDAETSPTEELRPRQAPARPTRFQLAQAAALRRRLAPTGPPPHHQATPPPESPPTPTETLPHRHAHGPTTPAPAKPQAAPRETYTAKHGHSLPLPRLCATEPRATVDKPKTCSPDPANFASLFNVPCPSLRPPLNLLRLDPLRPRLRDGRRDFLSPFHHGPGFGKNGNAFPFLPWA